MKAKEKLPIERWYQIFDKMNCLGLESAKDCGQFLVFGTFLLYFFERF